MSETVDLAAELFHPSFDDSEPETSELASEALPSFGEGTEDVGAKVPDNFVLAMMGSTDPENSFDRFAGWMQSRIAADAEEARQHVRNVHAATRKRAGDALRRETSDIVSAAGPDMTEQLVKRMRQATKEEEQDDAALAIEQERIAKALKLLPDFERLGRLLRCPVLLEDTVDPVMLACGHTLSRRAARQLYSDADFSTFPCPVCKGPHTKPVSARLIRGPPLQNELVRALVGKKH